jgi:GT2 family glycosyltransferase
MAGQSLTVAVPCFQQTELLPDLLASLAGLELDEVIVLDDGNPTPIVVQGDESRFRVARHEHNLGLAAARNRLLQEARGELILFLDADTRLMHGSAAAIASVFSNSRIAAVTGHVIEDGNHGLADRWRSWFWRQDHGEVPAEVELAYGLCCVWRRRALHQLGGFDERLRTHAEDIDISLRATGQGWMIRHDPSLVVRHCRRDSVRSLLAMVWNHSLHYSRVCLRHRHPLYRRALVNACWWLPITVWSSLRRHHDPAMALLSIPAGKISILARLWALVSTRE